MMHLVDDVGELLLLIGQPSTCRVQASKAESIRTPSSSSTKSREEIRIGWSKETLTLLPVTLVPVEVVSESISTVES